MFLFSPMIVLLIVLVIAGMGFHVLREYERAVIFRWGRLARGLIGGNGPGVIVIIPFVDKLVRVSLRTVTMDVPPQDVITKDNVSVKVNAVIYFRVVDQQRAIIDVEDYLYATSMMAQTTLRSVLGQGQLDDLLARREEINTELQRIIDMQTEPWASRCQRLKLKTLTCRKRCNAPLPSKRRPSGNGGRKSFMPKAISSRSTPGGCRQHHEPESGFPAAPLSADAGGDRRREEFDDDFSGSHRHSDALHQKPRREDLTVRLDFPARSLISLPIVAPDLNPFSGVLL